MVSSSLFTHASTGTSGQTAAAPAPASGSIPSDQQIQEILDQAVGFNLFAVPVQSLKSVNEAISGLKLHERLHRFEVLLAPPSTMVQATNTLGEQVGTLELQWCVVPDDFVARPDQFPQGIPLNPTASQRFVMQQMTITFDGGKDGFRAFGTGRTYPMMVGNQERIAVSAVANVTEGFGRFRNHEGNFTLCGDLIPGGFKGDILVRFQDRAGDLRVQGNLPGIQPQRDPDPQTSYLLWTGRKDEEQPGIENHFSLDPDKQVRGLDITTQLRILRLDFAVQGGFQGQSFSAGRKIVGVEIGFGRGSLPDAPPTGTPLSPYMFEGVALYRFFDCKGNTVGSLMTNVTEGRRFDMPLQGVPGNLAWRFGFFGPIVYGTGCFEGVQGLFYGSSGSVFYSLPGGQVITHFYMARLNDPDGRFRVPSSTGGWY